jgi:hypothetical protein
MMELAEADVLALSGLPRAHRAQVNSTNPLEQNYAWSLQRC